MKNIDEPLLRTERLTFSQKNMNNQQWYREWADRLDRGLTQNNFGYGGVSEYKRMKVNYDLFNGNINLNDFSYVCKPFGANTGELPARMVNRDIVSSKIKSILGMEMRRPFSLSVIAVNPEATTRKEQKESSLIRDFTINTITKPIRQQLELQVQEKLQGKELTFEEQQQILLEIDAQMKTLTPDEVKKYMEREHQDPAEILGNQLIEYLKQKHHIKDKFNLMFKHGLLSGSEIMFVSVLNGQLVFWNVNSMQFNSEISPNNYFIEDSENAVCEYRMTPSEVVKYFGDELTDSQIDNLYYNSDATESELLEQWLESDSDTLEDDTFNRNNNTIRVLHCVWKALRKIGFLQYLDENNDVQEKLVDESYKIDPEIGDLSIEWEWIPECYETWKVKDMYLYMRPIENQFKDINNVYECKLPYYGVIYDNLNSSKVSLMDRIKAYQYFYNIIMYRLELLLASDKGKKVLMNINSIPDSAGFDIKKWQYFFESSPFMLYDPNEEGTGYQDVNTVAKTLDLSLVSDIKKYIDLAEYIRIQCGRSVGITDQVEGQISPSESVTNTQQNLVQTSYILEPYFDLHTIAKRNIIEALIEASKVAYSGKSSVKLSYVLDDMSKQILYLDSELLDNSTYGIFVSDSSKASEVKMMLRQMAHAALQNQKIELSDVISVIKTDGIADAEEVLKVAEKERKEWEQNLQMKQQESNQKQKQAEHQFKEVEHQMKLKEIVLKEEERRKTELAKAAITGASFNADVDRNNNGINDFIEIANKQVELDLKQQDINLKIDALQHKKEMDKKKLENDSKKAGSN